MANKPPSEDNNNIFSAGKGKWSDYFSDDFFQDCAKSEHWRMRMVEAMAEFGRDPKSLFYLDFCVKFNIPRTQLYKLVAKYPDLAKAYEEMKNLIGLNRCKQVPLQFVMQHDQYRYDSEWDEGEKRKAELNKKPDEHKQHITVVMPKPEVMDKPEKE